MDSVVRTPAPRQLRRRGRSPDPRAAAWRLRKAKSLGQAARALARAAAAPPKQVMELLWPERDPEAAASNLHQALYVARRALAAAAGADASTVLPLRDDMLVLAPAGGVEVDVDEFDAAVARARDTGALVDHLAALRRYDARPAVVARCAGVADVMRRGRLRTQREPPSSPMPGRPDTPFPASRPATAAWSSTCRP